MICWTDLWRGALRVRRDTLAGRALQLGSTAGNGGCGEYSASERLVKSSIPTRGSTDTGLPALEVFAERVTVTASREWRAAGFVNSTGVVWAEERRCSGGALVGRKALKLSVLACEIRAENLACSGACHRGWTPLLFDCARVICASDCSSRAAAR